MQAMTECVDALKLPAVRPYFTASVFLKMSKDTQGTVSIPSFHHYIVRKNAMLQTVSIKALLAHNPSGTCGTYRGTCCPVHWLEGGLLNHLRVTRFQLAQGMHNVEQWYIV